MLVARVRIAAAAALVLAGAWCEGSSARIVRVPVDAATIQAGIDAASGGDTVLVAPGTYTGAGNRDITFAGKAIVVRSAAGAAATIVDCQASADDPHRGFLFASQEPRAAVLEGFTIVNGYMSTLPSEPAPARHDLSAGGIKIQDASPTIRDCVIRDCASEFTGGGMSIEILAAPRIERCIIQGCVSGIGGGGISIETQSAPEIADCVVTGNRAASGGGIACLANASIRSSVVAGNAAQRGGGVEVLYPARATFDRSIVWGNCGGSEGEIFVDAGARLTMTCSVLDPAGAVVAEGGQLLQPQPNVHAAPLFCSPLACAAAPVAGGDYQLQAGSPCLAPGNACGVHIGPLGEACRAQTPVQRATWGRLRSAFR